MKTYTKGPWVCDPPIKGHDHINVWGKSGIGHVASVSTGLTPDSSAVSNARLIAAAPDLLESLTAILEAMPDLHEFENPNGEPVRVLVEAARAVVAKASLPNVQGDSQSPVN